MPKLKYNPLNDRTHTHRWLKEYRNRSLNSLAQDTHGLLTLFKVYHAIW